MTIRRHLNGTYSELLVSETGEWQYDDAAEHNDALDLFYRCRINLARVDDDIEAGKIVPAADAMKARAQLLRFIVDGKDDLARNLGRRLAAVARQDTAAYLALVAELKLLVQRDQESEDAKLAGLESMDKDLPWVAAIMQAIRDDPTRSDRAIGRDTGSSARTVGRYRKKVR